MGWEREAVSEWASEGSFERREQGLPVGADGTPPVIHRGTYDGTCKRVDISIRNVNLGGIAEVYAFVPYRGQERFFIRLQTADKHFPGTAILAKHDSSSAAQSKNLVKEKEKKL